MTRVEPNSTTNLTTSTSGFAGFADGTDALVEEMLKLQGMEELEVTENDASSIENELVKSKKIKMSNDDVCFEKVVVANDVVVDVEVDGVTTSFWTPCASPRHYYIPSPSPFRDGNQSRKNSKTENEDNVVLGDSSENTMSFVTIEIHS
ncbi:unnamed protein product [Dovyalis caffra]|uniref:Uncharacterized protein n=1 Tax=Dovyalis caffra TaxID=77055 RepID=A0AAV1RE16_9ROSI|nr:unnamed protein product [Dovyalis caffra]